MRAQGGGNGESHFTVEVVSSAFEGKVSYMTTYPCCPAAYPFPSTTAPNATASLDLFDTTS